MRGTAFKHRLVWDAAATVLVALLISGPALFTHNGFMYDWTNALWTVLVQQQQISAHGLPSYYAHAQQMGVFYPLFMFYGGTLYTLVGGAGALLGGHPIVAFLGEIFVATLAAYAGGVWLGRQLGLRGWIAHAPALTFVTSAYYVSDLYGRGDWNEWTAVSMIPLVAAAALAFVSGTRARPGAAVLLVIGTTVLSGSHNITLLLSAVFGVLLVVTMRPALGPSFPRPGARRFIALGALLTVAVAVNAWFLLPDVFYAQRTQVAHSGITQWASSAPLNTLGALLDPFRPKNPLAYSTPALYYQLPMFMLVWFVLAVATVRRGVPRQLRRAGAVLVVLLIAMIVAFCSQSVWNALPLHGVLQFPYRTVTYMSLDVSALVLVAALAMQAAPARAMDRRSALSRATWLQGTLGLGLAASVALCVWQLWVPTDRIDAAYPNRNDALVASFIPPRTYYAFSDYSEYGGRVINPPAGQRVSIDPAAVSGNSATVTIDPPDNRRPFATDIAAGPYAVTISGGVKRVGMTTGGAAVLERAAGHRTGPVRIHLAAPSSGAVEVGQIVTLLALLSLAAALCGVAWRARARRRLSH